MSNNYAVIMAGGRGERFWPLSRSARPKQFLDIFEGKPLIRHAADRLQGVVPPDHLFVVTSADLVDATREALPALPPAQIVGEPCRRDTAAACALGTELVAHLAGSDEATLAILTADQLMGDLDVFRRTLSDAFRLVAEQPVIATIGITPTYPATGFGYIESADPLPLDGAATEFRRVARFVEKPDAETAALYLAGGRHFWNSGMFLWSVRTFREALRRYRPVLADAFAALAPHLGAPDAEAALAAAYAPLERISIDYAVMEKADNIVMARGAFAWDDVGSLTALPAHFPADAAGNVTIGRTALREAERNVVVSREDGHLVAVFGASDLVVVHTSDATLVCPRARAAELKALVQQIVAQPGGEAYL